MWKYSLLLLIILPLAISKLNHPVISGTLLIVWMAIMPMCILHVIDYLRYDSGNKPTSLLKILLQVPVGLFGLFSFVMGVVIVVWCLYNVFVQLLPEYTGPTGVLGLLMGGFGTAPMLISFGWYLMCLALGRKPETWEGLSTDAKTGIGPQS